MKIALILCTVLSLGNCLCSEISQIKNRFREDIVLLPEVAKDFFVEEIKTWTKTITAYGTWKDIDYTLDDNKFTPGEHPRRLDFMARAYSSPGHPMYKNKAIVKAVKKAFDNWCARDIQSYNWWHNTIGIPQRFARTMLLLENELGEERIKKGIKILEKAKIGKTGQNRLWYSELVTIRGLFEKDNYDIERGAKEIHKVLKLSGTIYKSEGIQADYSFHQHGPLIYNGGYGSKYSRDMARLVSIFDGTQYSFPKEKTDLLSSYILDGQIWMSRGDKWDYSVTGREISRKGKSAEKLTQACRILMNTDLKRKEEFKKCYESLTENKTYLNGNKMFWRSDYMVQQSPKYFASVRMYSNRLLNNDAPSNSEGLLSHHLADGATFIMRRGDEYEDVFPVWDWRKVPGTTTELKKLKPAVYRPGFPNLFSHIRYFGSSRFVGGVSDDKSGIAAMDFISNKIYESVDAKKTWVLDENAMYAFGNSISCKRCDDVVTTLDQKNANGEVLLLRNSTGVETFSGEQTYEDLRGVYHDGIAYFFPHSQSVTVKLGKQTGDWNRINGQYDDKKVSKDIFSLWINHSLSKANNKYAYFVVPGLSPQEFTQYKELIQFINQQNFNAVSLGEKIYFIARKKVDVTFAGHHFKLKEPAAFIFNTKTKLLKIADPTQNDSRFDIEIDEETYKDNYPTGRDKGKTITVSPK